MAIKALAARGIGGGRGGGRGGRSSGMLQTPNQDNFIKIHSAILETNSKLADLSNQMKRGGFEKDIWMHGYQQGMQGNSQPSSNSHPPVPANTPLSLSEHAFTRSMTRDSFNLSRDDLNSPIRQLNAPQEEAIDEGIQGHIEHSPHIEVPGISTQTETRMYDTHDMVSVMPHATLISRLKANGIDTTNAPTGIDDLRHSTSELYKEEFKKHLRGVEGAIDLNLLQSGPRGRPRLHDPIIEPVEDGEED